MEKPAAARLTLTVNRRFARALVQAHAVEQRAGGATAWVSPDILPYHSWLRRCLAELARRSDTPQPVVLDAFQERLLWARAVAEARHPAGREALQPRIAARLAQHAHELLLRYRVADAQWMGSDLPESRALQAWLMQVRRVLRRGGWLAPGALGEVVHDGFAQGRLVPPERLTLAGFDVLSPEQERILRLLVGLGTRLVPEPLPHTPAVPRWVVSASPRDELSMAASWARELLQRNPACSVGVLVADLARRRDAVWDVFEEQLQGNWFEPQRDAPRSFELSLGEALSRHPLVRAAEAVIAAAGGKLSLDEASTLLMTPFTRGAGVEAEARARVDAWLRARGEPRVATRRLVQLSRNARVAGPRGGATLFAERLDTLCREATTRRRQQPSVWASQLIRWLQVMGWPGESTLGSRRYQVVQAFRECVESLASLDGLLGRIPLAALREHLHQLLEERIHQPALEGPTPVQVFGGLEAIGVRVDALWITGMHDGAWPSMARPNPLLPIALQKRHGMPGADSASELARARAITRRWLCAAPRVWISHARFDADQPLRASRMFPSLPQHGTTSPPGDRAARAPASAAHAMAARAATLERLLDERLPPLPVGQLARGGAAVLRDMSACPFQAAARHRLGARAIEQPVHPLDARMRGTAAHRLMQYLWEGLGTWSRLIALDPAALDQRIRGCVDRVLDGLRRELPETVRGGLRQVEHARLTRLARAWLAIESGRPPFQVRAAEQRQRLHAGGLVFDVRIDRIDTLGDGRALLIDYKTGRCQVSDWLGERPREPQLPLYAAGFLMAGADSGLGGVSFACLRSGEMGFRGVGEGESVPSTLDPPGRNRLKAMADMRVVVEGWRERVDSLARGLRHGDAHVAPRDGALTCQHCELGALCRIGDARRAWP